LTRILLFVALFGLAKNDYSSNKSHTGCHNKF